MLVPNTSFQSGDVVWKQIALHNRQRLVKIRISTTGRIHCPVELQTANKTSIATSCKGYPTDYILTCEECCYCCSQTNVGVFFTRIRHEGFESGNALVYLPASKESIHFEVSLLSCEQNINFVDSLLASKQYIHFEVSLWASQQYNHFEVSIVSNKNSSILEYIYKQPCFLNGTTIITL